MILCENGFLLQNVTLGWLDDRSGILSGASDGSTYKSSHPSKIGKVVEDEKSKES